MYKYIKANKEHRLLYLQDDMKIMGYLFENIQKNIPNIDVEFFVENFMNSYTREAMDACQPQIMNMAAINVLERHMENGGEIKLKETPEYYRLNELYWIGSTYAYISIQNDIGSKELIKKLPFNSLLKMYNIGHEMSYSSFLGHLDI